MSFLPSHPQKIGRRVLALAGLLLVPARGHEITLPRFLAQAAPAATPTNPGSVARLTIELRMEGRDTPVPGLVRVTSVTSGQPVALASHLRRPMGWFSLPARATVEIPAGEVRIEACQGLHTELSTVTHAVAQGNSSHVVITLRPFYDLAARNLVAGNTHLHLRLNAAAAMGGALLRSRADAEDYLTGIGNSDRLDFVYVSHLARESEDQSYVSNQFTRDDLARLSQRHLHFVNGEEHRHEGGRSSRRGGPEELRYGHVLFLDLPRLVAPVSYGAIFRPNAASDATPMRRAIREAREQNASIVWCHGKQGTEHIPNWIDGLLHAQNIFDGGSEGSFETVFYPYLNAGFRVPFSTGTDWGCYDFSRVYVALPAPASNPEFLRHLGEGRSFITNGPLLEFTVDDQTAGNTLDLARPTVVKIRARGIGRDDFARIEVVFNGAVRAQAASQPVGAHFVAEHTTSIEITEPGWLALRIPLDRPYSDRSQYRGAGANLFGKALFAHTSPIYINLAGRGVRDPAAIRALITDVETSIRTIEARGAFADEAERSALLAIYRDAIATLQKRLPADTP